MKNQNLVFTIISLLSILFFQNTLFSQDISCTDFTITYQGNGQVYVSSPLSGNLVKIVYQEVDPSSGAYIGAEQELCNNCSNPSTVTISQAGKYFVKPYNANWGNCASLTFTVSSGGGTVDCSAITSFDLNTSLCNNNGTTTPSDDHFTYLITTTGNTSETYDVYSGPFTTGAGGQLIDTGIPIGTTWESPSYLVQDGTTSFAVHPTNATPPTNLASTCTSFTSQSVPNCATCDDNDNDGICADADCNDDDPTIGVNCPPTGGSTLWTEGFNGIYTDSKVMINNDAGLLSKRVTVQTDVFADYVFEKDYPLLPLDELEAYIQKNKHLPNIPPAEEVIKQGINVSELAVQQMEKIEELTLYIIQQQKEINILKKRLEQIEQSK